MPSIKLIDPKPGKRRRMLAYAEKRKGICEVCKELKPLHQEGDSEGFPGICPSCVYLVDSVKMGAKTDKDLQLDCDLKHGELCNDCAFRPGSPESKDGTLDKLIKDSLDTIFYCHKPFHSPLQQWGYDPASKTLIPLKGDHWRACGGWVKTVNRDLRKLGFKD